MKITKETLSRIILEELESLDEKPSRQAKRQKKAQAKAKRRQARKEKAASPKQNKPEQKAKKSEFAGLSPEEQSDALEKKLFGDKPKNPQAAAKAAAQQAKKTEKATTKAGLQAATGEKVDTDEQPEEIQKVSNEIKKLQKKLQSWAMKTAAKIPAEDKKARLAVMKIPMALKIANQSIDKISKQGSDSFQAVLSGEKPAAKPKEAAANRREIEEAVIYDLEELFKNEA